MLYGILKRFFPRPAAVVGTPLMFILSLVTTATAVAVLSMPMTTGQAIAHGDSVASEPAPGAFSINAAHWDKNHRYKRIVIEGLGTRGQAVTVTNADTGTSVGTTSVRYTKWRVRQENPQTIPCRVRALSSNGETAEKAIDNALPDCDSGVNVPSAATIPEPQVSQ
jgi:hypothetical protein